MIHQYSVNVYIFLSNAYLLKAISISVYIFELRFKTLRHDLKSVKETRKVL